MRTWTWRAAALALLLGRAGLAAAGDVTLPRAADPPPPVVPAPPAPAVPDSPLTPIPNVGETVSLVPHDGVWGSFLPRLSLEYFTGPGFGYSNGYTTLDGFIPIAGSSLNHLVYLDLRGIVSDANSLWGNNVGVGYRFYHPPLDRIFGAWTSWDLRNTNYATYNQVSGGIETIGRYLDFRNNTYIVLGPQTTATAQYLLPQPFFQNNNVMFPLLTKFDSALSGTDMELGGPLPYLGRYGVRAYAGGYVFHGDMVGTFGGAQGRLVTRLSNNLDFSLQVRNDQAFGTTVVFGGALRWGGVRRSLRDARDSVYNRMADPVQRNYNVAVLDPLQVGSKPAIDTTTGQPLKVIHVNNQAPAGGDGSVEHPLNALVNAPSLAGNYGIILIDRGNGTTSGLNQGVVLTTGERLLGNSMAYTFDSRQFGTLPLPNQPGGMPILTSTGGPAVVLANGTEVAGLQIVGAGIAGNGIQNFNIHDVQINGGNIAIRNASGTGFITNTSVTGSLCDGVAIGSAGSGALILALNNNNFSGNAGNGLALGSVDNSMLTANIAGSTFNNNGAGLILCGLGTSSLVANLSSSTLNGNSGPGVTANSGGASTLGLTLNGNTISNNAAGGVVVTTKDQSNATFTMTGNTLSGNGSAMSGDGVRIGSTTSGSFALQITGNTILNSGLTGIDLAAGGGTFSGTVANNTVNGSGGNGIGLMATDGITNVSFQGNTIRNSGMVGLAISRSGLAGQGEGESPSTSPLLTATAMNNTITGSGRQGIYVSDLETFAAPSSAMTVNLTNNQTSGNQGAGIALMSLGAFGSSNLVVHATGNTLTGDNAGGIDPAAFQATAINEFGSSYLGLRLTGNTSSPAQGNAFGLANTGGTFLFQDGGGNVPGTYTQVGTITPGVVP